MEPKLNNDDHNRQSDDLVGLTQQIGQTNFKTLSQVQAFITIL